MRHPKALRLLWAPAVVACTGLLFNTWNGFADGPGNTASKPKTPGELSYIAPGEQSDTVKHILEEIEREYVRAQRPLENIWVTARYGATSHKSRPYDSKSGFGEPPRDQIEPRHWNSLELVIKNGKKRFQCDTTLEEPSSHKEYTSYRVFDGEMFASLDENSLELFPQKSGPEADWQSIIPHFYKFQRAFDGKQYSLVPSACAFLRTWIDFAARRPSIHYILRCTKEASGLITFAFQPTDSTVGRICSFTVDSKKGYQLVDAVDYLPDSGLPVKLILRNVYTEIAPQVYFLKQSQRSIFAQSESSPPQWRIETLQVTDVKLGDFQYDESKFTLASLPIPKGTIVTDHRSDPPHQYVYAQAPLDEQRLRKSLGPARHSSHIRWLIAANVVVVLSVLCIFFWRKRRNS